jgi:hypothetical protein
MTDPLRSDRPPASGETPERDREARVEELLLAGLDHYFSGQHDLAINVWTRVLFLDRGHARARAYIERARGAISERQREGDELLHTGADAFNRGDVAAARRLLTSAVDRGAGGDEALALLQRLDRLEAAAGTQAEAPVVDRAVPPAPRPSAPGAQSNDPGSARVRWIGVGLLGGMLAAAVAAVYLWPHGMNWLGEDPGSRVVVPSRVEEPLPVPAASEFLLKRARTLAERGRLHDALAALEGIRLEDKVRPEADELRARIQRDLLAAARSAGPAPQRSAPTDRR